MPQPQLFDDAPPAGGREALSDEACVLRGFALTSADALLAALARIERAAPFRHMRTPGGYTMSVALTNCGALGWTSDERGYRYAATDPQSGLPWPPLPAPFLELARSAAAVAGFGGFRPDACLINRYLPGNRLSLHQDRNERDFSQPIVSLSLGLPAVFLFGGLERSDKPGRIPLTHGDVLVWGGPARLRFHGVLPVGDGHHPATGACRLNLTFRKAG